MKSTSQLDLHPDADSLNAFAEEALGAAEREQILAHMTRCSRCREVVYLAQKAADAEALETGSATPPGRWYKSWRFVWVPAAALAAALALVVTFYPRHTAPAPEMAKVVPQSAQPTPVPLEQANAGAALKPAPPAVANSVAERTSTNCARRPAACHLSLIPKSPLPHCGRGCLSLALASDRRVRGRLRQEQYLGIFCGNHPLTRLALRAIHLLPRCGRGIFRNLPTTR